MLIDCIECTQISDSISVMKHGATVVNDEYGGSRSIIGLQARKNGVDLAGVDLAFGGLRAKDESQKRENCCQCALHDELRDKPFDSD